MVDAIVVQLVTIIDLVTILLIFYAFLQAVFQFLLHHLYKAVGRPKKYHGKKVRKIRVKLGEYLLLALEIFICADIILSVKDPTIEHLIHLGAIVVIRILIAYFLQKEIIELRNEKQDDDDD